MISKDLRVASSSDSCNNQVLMEVQGGQSLLVHLDKRYRRSSGSWDDSQYCSIRNCERTAKIQDKCLTHATPPVLTRNKQYHVSNKQTTQVKSRRCKVEECQKYSLMGGYCIAHGNIRFHTYFNIQRSRWRKTMCLSRMQYSSSDWRSMQSAW